MRGQCGIVPTSPAVDVHPGPPPAAAERCVGLNTLMTALGGRYVDLGQVRDRFQPCRLVTYRPLQVPEAVRGWNHA